MGVFQCVAQAVLSGTGKASSFGHKTKQNNTSMNANVVEYKHQYTNITALKLSTSI